MTNDEIIERTNAAIAEEFELDMNDLVPSASFKEDLGLDSLDAVDMVIVLEQEFGIKIGKDPKILRIRQLSDLHSYVIDKKNAFLN
ncbi:acyl carrier protein [Desulfomicrobium apsheronum]|jgi:acyl carrier protein|uniref:Acyl carrier protein n=1 Tax=Desulfomicrobium apsheronum TaxID=52560 RepID=A0A1I3VTJ1_9BACT|nr:phosphopantetheine-binding protein [Desulfomicrobium apsheronum]NCC04389.1 acyl carrier protein [Pseudomonadota bacterium]SFJ98470.1 acyl carrier protein [Desulfomicrobium apsheronum]